MNLAHNFFREGYVIMMNKKDKKWEFLTWLVQATLMKLDNESGRLDIWEEEKWFGKQGIISKLSKIIVKV